MIVVIGCGRVGLPLSLFLAGKGLRVTGVDSDAGRVETIKKGRMPFFEEGAGRILREATARGLFSVTERLQEVVEEADTFIITVGTPLNEMFIPLQEGLMDLVLSIASARRSSPPAIFLRSTIAPGTSQNLRRELAQRGLRIGRDLYYAYCPERIAEGRALEELGTIPQIIGAFDRRSAGLAGDFFSGLGLRCIAGTPAEAELAKLFNNMYRYVNFALANQCLYLAEKNNASTPAVLEMCNLEYPRGGPWPPGFAAGPCLFKDGFFLSNQLLFVDLLLSSWKINESLPEVLLREVEASRPLGRVALLGLAFKGGVDDTRNSLGVKLHRILTSRGISVAAHDPLVHLPGCCASLEEALAGASEIFVMAPHRQYKILSRKKLKKLAAPGALVVDPWFLWFKRLMTVL